MTVTLSGLTHVVVAGAHCDDIAIGCGATLLTLRERFPGLTVSAFVLTGAGTAREAEERAALEAFCGSDPSTGSGDGSTGSGDGSTGSGDPSTGSGDGSTGSGVAITIAGLPDARTPAHWLPAKEALAAFKQSLATPADLVIGPHRGDAHQDHRLLAELLVTEFRTQPVWGYEILKYESDLPRVDTYVPVSVEVARAKSALILSSYPSQNGHPWFDEEAFLGLLRVRGAQCNTRYAEGFVVAKTVIKIGDRT